jgi:phenylpyruvate tautomerase PptA (4-oxalocrotonate tautomerase family)
LLNNPSLAYQNRPTALEHHLYVQRPALAEASHHRQLKMPLIYVHYPEGSLNANDRDSLVAEITRAGVELEHLPVSEYVLSTTWAFTREYPAGHVYNGGSPVSKAFVAVEINVIQGGYSASTKAALIDRVTTSVGRYFGMPSGEPRRVYVVIREVAEANWGFDGQTIDLEVLRNPAEGSVPL